MKNILNLPLNLHKAWLPLSFTTKVPLQYTSSLASTSPILANTEILEIEDFISGKEMTILEIFKRSFMTDILEYIASINPDTSHLLDRLKIAYQISMILRNKSSKFVDTIETFLNEQPNFPIYWKNIKCTSCVPLRQIIANEYFLYRNSYDKIFDLNKQVVSNVNFEEYIWVNTIASDKAVQIEENFHFVPVFESFPHDFENNTVIVKDASKFKVLSCKDIPENTVLTRNYGLHDNYTFLLKHGFIPHNNPYHLFPVYPENLPVWEEAFTKLRINDTSILNSLQNSKNYSMHSLKRQLFQKFTKEGLIGNYFSIVPPSKSLEINFRIFFLNETDMKDLKLKDYDEANNLDFTKPLTENNERNVRVMIFKTAELAELSINQGFDGEHPLGKKIEDIDKEIVQSHFNHYKKLLGLAD